MPERHPLSFKANGRWHRLIYRKLKKLWGVAYREECEMHVDPTARGRKELDTYIHEHHHLEFPWLREPYVAEAATNLANLLWDLGYRRKK